MKGRCFRINFKQQKDYADRGITVCQKWMKFDGFFEDMGVRPPNTTLDRKNNDLGYYKENCRWATWSEQQSNKRCNQFVIFNGVKITVGKLAKQECVFPATIRYIIKKLPRGSVPTIARGNGKQFNGFVVLKP